MPSFGIALRELGLTLGRVKQLYWGTSDRTPNGYDVGGNIPPVFTSDAFPDPTCPKGGQCTGSCSVFNSTSLIQFSSPILLGYV